MFGFTIYDLREGKTPNPKPQTPEKPQTPSSKRATSGRQLGFGDWDFFAVWSLVFGVFIPVFAAYLGFGFWDLEFSMVSAADSFKRMSPALARRLNIGPPPLILPRRLPGFCSPDTVVVTGIALTTFPPLLSASRSTATERGSVTVMSPP